MLSPGRFVVTGCGRSGTQYVSGLLRMLGIKSGHETVYNHDLVPANPDLEKIDRRWEKVDVEVSWIAAPFLFTLPEGSVVWHQTRDLLKVVRCWYHHGLLRPDPNIAPLPPVANFVHLSLPCCMEGSELEKCIKYVLCWNDLIERQVKEAGLKYFRYKVEDITAELLSNMLKESGYNIPIEKIQKALDDQATNVGTCSHPPEHDIPWERVLQEHCGDELYEMVARYGYT